MAHMRKVGYKPQFDPESLGGVSGGRGLPRTPAWETLAQTRPGLNQFQELRKWLRLIPTVRPTKK